MQWEIRYRPITGPLTGKGPWQVYKIDHERETLEKSFLTEDEAHMWADRQERKFGSSTNYEVNHVDEASRESFPASDPPAWTRTATGSPNDSGSRKAG